MDQEFGPNYLARKALFAKGLRQGRLTTQEIEAALPSGTLTASERWLLYYSLRASQVEIIDELSEEAGPGDVDRDPSLYRLPGVG